MKYSLWTQGDHCCSFCALRPAKSLVVIFVAHKTSSMMIDGCVFSHRVHDMAAIKTSVGSCSKLQLAEDDLLIVNVSMRLKFDALDAFLRELQFSSIFGDLTLKCSSSTHESVNISGILAVVTVCMSHRQRKVYSGHGHLCECVSVCLSPHVHTTARTRCNLGEW